MTTPRPEGGTLQGVLDWLEGELRQLKAQVRECAQAAEQNRAQLWQLGDQIQGAETGDAQLAAQISLLAALPEEARSLRERVDRLQNTLGQDREQAEALARQLRAEMHAERDERGELRRRTEFSEQTSATLAEKIKLNEELVRASQDQLALTAQRLEQADISLAGLDARSAANAETLRRLQADGRNLASEGERLERSLAETGDRVERVQEIVRRVQERLEHFASVEEQFTALRDRADGMRQSNDALLERMNTVSREQEGVRTRLDEAERGLERARVKAEQQDRSMTELRLASDENRARAERETDRFLAFQEKLRRRQIADLEQEIREVRGHPRQRPDA